MASGRIPVNELFSAIIPENPLNKRAKHTRFTSSSSEEAAGWSNCDDTSVLLEKIRRLEERLATYQQCADVRIIFHPEVQFSTEELKVVSQCEVKLRKLVQKKLADCSGVMASTSGAEEGGGIFCVDRTPVAPYDEQGDSVVELNSDIRSESLFSTGDHLPVDNADSAAPKQSPRPRRNPMVCFNCGGEHMLAKCSKPLDQRRIAKNRMIQRSQQRSSFVSSTRYHDEQLDHGFRPGRLSRALVRALGLRPDELPPWIHQMRQLGPAAGYPPGYLKQALVSQTSTLDFHVSKDSTDSNGQVESVGQVLHGRREAIVDLDTARIVPYDGFNVPPTRAVRDDGRWRYPANLGQFAQLLRQCTANCAPPTLATAASSASAVPDSAAADDMELSDGDEEVESPESPSGSPELSSAPFVIVDSADDYEDCTVEQLEQIQTDIMRKIAANLDSPAVAANGAAAAADDEGAPHAPQLAEGQSRVVSAPTSRSLTVVPGATVALSQPGAPPGWQSFGDGIQPFEPVSDEPPGGRRHFLQRVRSFKLQPACAAAHQASDKPAEPKSRVGSYRRLRPNAAESAIESSPKKRHRGRL